ncbi:MAG: GTPase HflX [Alphaproteobacteria bacterium]
MRQKDHTASDDEPAGTFELDHAPGLKGRERCLVVIPVIGRVTRSGTGKSVGPGNGKSVGPASETSRAERASRSPGQRADEARGLAEAIRLTVCDIIEVTRQRPVPATLIGKGKVDDIGRAAKACEAGLVLVDYPLSPVQQRNLEKAWLCKVIDRTGLILEIFGDRAKTREGRMQVELAHLNYQKSRLVRSWTHLERQRGGFGFLGGPGETQIEADRRQLQTRIRTIEKALASVAGMRAAQRANRKRSKQMVVALVGYTNAGKSTLFNQLTGAGVSERDMLFATLDPTLRKVALPHGETILLSDTVGFISDLPTTLVAAFRATLEEVTEADLILHVRDISSDQTDMQAADVRTVLAELGVAPDDPRIMEVWNKIDLLPPDARNVLADSSAVTTGHAVAASARTGEGCEAVLAAIETRIAAARPVLAVSIRPERFGSVAWLYENAEVLERSENPETGVANLKVRIPEARLTAFRNWARKADVKPVRIDASTGERAA